MDIAKALSFIDEHGSNLEKARMKWIVYQAQPEPAVIRPFVQLQNEDGGYPCAMTKGNLSSIDNTLVALWWLDEIGMKESSAADKAFGYLLAVQKNDGGWDEAPSIAQHELPPWIIPGDLRTKLYLSSYSAYFLAARGYVNRPAFHKALDFLLKHQDRTGKFYGYLHNTWIATSVFAMAGDPYAGVVKRGLGFLMDRPLSEWADSQIAWALDCLASAGLPKEHAFVERSLAELIRRQQADGTWISEDGAEHDVGATIAAVKALKHYGFQVGLALEFRK
ncbi:terpene cyclase/mutase family protein [candidate division WOR-3 bacterium]|nr:terpene cyclase/mutase family protein [candidate division WOR-3 bacterium]